MTTTIELPQVSSVIKSKIKAILNNGFTTEQERKISQEKSEVFHRYGDDTTEDDLRESISWLLPEFVFTSELLEEKEDEIETCLNSDVWEAIYKIAIWDVPDYVDDTVDQLLAKINALSTEDRKSLLNRIN
jgi:hypothetical protein